MFFSPFRVVTGWIKKISMVCIVKKFAVILVGTFFAPAPCTCAEIVIKVVYYN